MRTLLATCRVLPEPDPDQELLLAALAAEGVEARMAAWDDPGSWWEWADLVVLRSTWNYYLRPAEFLVWARKAAAVSRLMNPLRVVEWNHHKGYLLQLEASGIPIVPTVLLRRGEPARLADIMTEKRWETVVVKPAVSAASYRTARFDRVSLDAGEPHLAGLLEERDVLVQEYLSSVASTGERALIWVDGEFTHAVRKSPRLMGEDETVSGAIPIAPDERRLGELALVDFGRSELLYARVDLARDAAGDVRLMELELIEPSLFLVQHPPALARLVRGMKAI